MCKVQVLPVASEPGAHKGTVATGARMLGGQEWPGPSLLL